MKLIIALLSLFCCYACLRSERNLYLDTQSIKIQKENTSFSISFEDKNRIEEITNMLSCRKRSPAIFLPKFRIILENKSKVTTVVLVNARRIKIKGITYELCENMESVLDNWVK
jgi:hypothetical protein